MNSLELLRARRFLPYFITQFTGAFNDSLIRRGVEMLIAFKGLSGEIPPETAIFLLLALFMAPFFTFSAWGGFLADTIHKERLVRWIKLAELGVVILAAVGLHLHSLGISALGVLGLGIHSAFFGPVKFSLPPQHVKDGELIAANGLIEAGTNGAILLGTILGSLLIMLPSGETFLSLLGIATALAGLASSAFVPAAPPTEAALNAVRPSTLGLITKLYGDERLWRLAMGTSWFWTLGAILISLFPLIVKDILGAPEYFVSIFFGIFSIGVGAGSIFCNRLLKGQIEATWVPLSSMIMASAIVAFYLLLQGPAVGGIGPIDFVLSFRGSGMAFALFILSFAAGLFIVPLYGLMQHYTTDTDRSRIIAANNVLNASFMVIGSLMVAGAAYWGVSIGIILLFLAALNVAVAIYTAFLLPMELLRGVLRIAFLSVFRARTSGLEHLRAVGPRALIVANHLSFLDAVMLTAFLPRRPAFAVNTEIARLWWMRPVMRLMDALPIDPANPMAVRVLIERLCEDRHVVIFPEGRISVTGSLMKIYEGPALIADKAKAPLVPIRLEGFQYTLFSRVKKLMRWRLFPQLSMTVCAPRTLVVPDGLRGKARRERLGLELHDLMTTLMFETNQRGPTLLHGLEQAGAAVGSAACIAKDPFGKTVTIGQLLFRSFVLSRSLPPAVSGESALGILMPSGVPALILFFAAQWAKRVPAMLNFSHSQAQIDAACSLARLRTVITSRAFISIAKLDERLLRLREQGIRIVYLEDLAGEISGFKRLTAAAVYFGTRLRRFVTGFDPLPGGKDDPAVVLFTSGSEGTPKGVVLSHDNLLSNVDQLTAAVPLLPTDKVFNALPMFHSFGLTGATLMPILKGVPVYLYPTPLHYKAIPLLVYDESATILFGTPTFLAGYGKKAHPYDFYSLRYVFSGAERLPDAVRTMYQDKFGIRIFEGYGATETAPAIAVSSPFHYQRGSVGRLLPGIRHRLEPMAGVPEGGRLWVQGPNVMKGYFKFDNPGVLEPPQNGWYDTGDIVSIDPSGFIWIRGRAKRFAKIGGEMISLTAVEQAVESAWPKSLHAVISVSDDRKGERLVLITTQKSLMREELMTALRERGLSELAIPREIVLRDTIPLLGSGKVDLQQVTKDYFNKK